MFLAHSFLALLFLFAATCSGSGAGSGDDGDDDIPSSLSACGLEPLFNTLPLALDDFTGLVPLGNLNPSGHVFPTDHLYFYVTRSEAGDGLSTVPDVVTLTSPGDMVIVEIASSENITEESTDYSVYFQPCREVKATFLHVRSLSDPIVSAMGELENCETYTTGGNDYRRCSKEVEIEVTAGEEMGTAGGEGRNALDFGAWDSRIEALDYANPDRFDREDSDFDGLHVVCGIDYFIDDVKESLEARLGDYDGEASRMVEPLCGEVEQDEPGTAQGVWFVEGTTESTPEDPHLALVHDNIDPTRPVFSAGTSVTGLDSGVYFFTPQSSGLINRDFDDVTADGSVYCYDNFESQTGSSLSLAAIFLLRLEDAETLTIEAQSAADCGSGPWAFTGNAVIFER